MTEPAYWDKGSRETAQAEVPPRRTPVFWVIAFALGAPVLMVGMIVVVVVLLCCVPLIGWLMLTDRKEPLVQDEAEE